MALLPIRFERRLTYTRTAAILTTILAILLAFGAVAILFIILGLDVAAAFQTILNVFITPRLFFQAVVRGVPITLAALGLAIAFRMNFWNIGAEGQIYMGAFASTGIVLAHIYYGFLPEVLVLPTMFLTAFLAGGAWCLLPAVLKAKLNVNEILTTLMMNFIAILWVAYLIYGPWRDPEGFGFPLSIPFPDYAKFLFIAGNQAYTGFTITLIVAALIYLLFRYGKLGFELTVIGQSLDAARYAGINIAKAIVLGAFLSGGLAGIGGLSILSGIIGRLRPDLSPGYGYTAIIVSFLAALNPWLIVPAGIFFGGLFTAGEALQATLKIPGAAVEMFQSIIFIFIIFGEFLKRYRIVVGGGGSGG